jgi:hypothetical protein
MMKLAFGAATFACAALLSACGGGGGGSSAGGAASLTGVFSDSAVSGLTYVIGGVAAKTDASGHFTYKSGDTVTFKVGDVVLGSAVAQAFMSPVTLISGATDETNVTVTNIAKFLQTVDDDNNPSNGIQITSGIHSAAVGRTINFAQTSSAYDSDTAVTNAYAALNGASTSGTHAAVGDSNAQTHLQGTLLAAMAGTYNGNYSGSSSGTFTFTVNSGGQITSGTISNTGGAVMTGNIASGGGFSSSNPGTLGGNPVTVSFSGTISAGASTVSGNWSVSGSGYNFSGTFSGKK